MLPFPIISKTPILPKSEIVSYDSNNVSFCFTSGTGDLYFYGYNTYGNFGNGMTNSSTAQWYKSNEMNNVQRVFGNGSRCTVIIKNDGTVWVCGSIGNANQFGSTTLSTGNTAIWQNITASMPVPVSDIKYIKPGYQNSIILTNSGVVYFSGINNYNMFGVTGTKSTYTVIPFSQSTAVRDFYYYGMYSSSDTTSIVDYNNKLYMCGANSNKQIDSTGTSSYSTYTASLGSYTIKEVYYGTTNILVHTTDDKIVYSGISGVVNASGINNSLNGYQISTGNDFAGCASVYVYYGTSSTRACYASGGQNMIPILNTNNQTTSKTLVRNLPVAEAGNVPIMFCTELKESILFYKGAAGNNRLYALGSLVGQGSIANAQYVKIPMPTGF